MCFSVIVPLPYLINDTLNLGSQAYGIIQGGFAVGMILGAIFLNFFTKFHLKKNFLFVLGCLITLCIFLLSIPFPLILEEDIIVFTTLYTFFTLVLGFLIVLFDIPIIHTLQSDVDTEFSGRVIGLFIGVIKIVTPISFIFSGLLFD